MKTSKYLRKATRKFTCACCAGMISKGEEYIDFETVDYQSDNSILIKHKRLHKNCDRASVKYVSMDLPKPVQVCNVKYYLIGKLILNNKWYLLTKDWETDRFYKYRVVYDFNGNPIKPEDVEL